MIRSTGIGIRSFWRLAKVGLGCASPGRMHIPAKALGPCRGRIQPLAGVMRIQTATRTADETWRHNRAFRTLQHDTFLMIGEIPLTIVRFMVGVDFDTPACRCH
jgi:hypothetical protein